MLIQFGQDMIVAHNTQKPVSIHRERRHTYTRAFTIDKQSIIYIIRVRQRELQ